jgi:hypothetical protein
MYHPAAALHQPGLRETLMRDILKLPALLEKMKPKNTEAQQAEIKQLNLL